MQNYENPHEVASEAIEKNASEARTRAIALEMYADKTYTEENKGMKNGATALMLFCNSYSVGTVCAFLALSTLPAIAEHSGKIIAYGAGGALVLGIAATLEYAKVQSAKNFTKASLRYKKFAKVAFAGWVLAGGASAAASFVGAQMLPSAAVAPPVWSAAAFDDKEAIYQAEIEAIRKSAQWKGITTKAGLEQIKVVNKQQETLAADAAREIVEMEKRKMKEGRR